MSFLGLGVQLLTEALQYCHLVVIFPGKHFHKYLEIVVQNKHKKKDYCVSFWFTDRKNMHLHPKLVSASFICKFLLKFYWNFYWNHFHLLWGKALPALFSPLHNSPDAFYVWLKGMTFITAFAQGGRGRGRGEYVWHFCFQMPNITSEMEQMGVAWRKVSQDVRSKGFLLNDFSFHWHFSFH